MSLIIKRCGVSDITDIENAINFVKAEEDTIQSNKNAIMKFLNNENNLFYIDDNIILHELGFEIETLIK